MTTTSPSHPEARSVSPAADDAAGPTVRALLDAFDDAAFLIDTVSGELIELNLAASQWCGLPRSEMLQHGWAATPAIADLVLRAVEAADPMAWYRAAQPWPDAEGRPRWVEFRVRPLDVDGRRCTSVQLRDVTLSVSIERQTERHLAELQMAESLAGLGRWSLDVDSGTTRWSDEVYRMYGYPPGTAATYQKFLDRVDPRDRAAIDEGWKAACEGAEDFQHEFRVVVDGRTRWIRNAVRFSRDDGGQLRAVFGIHRDITEEVERQRRHAQDAVREARDLLHSSLSSMAQGIAVFDEHGRVKVHNDRMLELLELPRESFGPLEDMRDLARFQVQRGDFAEAEAGIREQIVAYAEGRIRPPDVDVAARYTRRTPQGRYLQIETERTSTGDLVRTYSDVTDYVMLNRQLDAVLEDWGRLRRREAARVQRQLLAALAELARHRDNETGRHIERTRQYVQTLARALARSGRCNEPLDEERIARLVEAAPMHDLGKIGVPDHILRKPARLTPEEMAVMRTHAAIGESVLRTAARGSLREMSALLEVAARIAGGHHEHWDGSGYPRGLAGTAIPLEARLMALADIYDALTTARVYKPAWPHDEAVAEILQLRGGRLDPLVVEMFEQQAETFRQIAERLADPPAGG